MLQYSVQLPPLSLTSSKPKNRAAVHARPTIDTDRTSFRSTPSTASSTHAPSPNPFSPKRTYAHAPLAISTALPAPPSPSLSSASPSLPPTPVFATAVPTLSMSSPLHSKPVPVPMSASARSPHPLKNVPLPSSPALSASAFGGSRSSSPSSFSSSAVDVLAPGDLVGEGLRLQGDVVRRVPIPVNSGRGCEEPAATFEVVRLLGTGSYAVVYLVREVLYRAPTVSVSAASDDGMEFDMSLDGHGDSYSENEREVDAEGKESKYGREYAIKVLSKGNLDEEALSAQMFEARIHQSLPPHPNIVTLHRTLETPAYLLLLLEFVPGEDLFYFLEQARDHCDTAPTDPATIATSPASSSSLSSSASSSTESSARTPPTPSLLGTLAPGKLLGRTRLRLIASMFGQMCDAVAACHARGVFHRDIKPENFIVTDGWHEVVRREVVEGSDGKSEVRERRERERRVVVKLTDFGLSTTDVHSADMDCGSAPYMSYECRNNIHPTYTPRAADVWSLGIVLINMLYHYNPWTDTTEGVCPSFTLYRQNPVHFFLARFAGMTPAVAEFLAARVFCILPDPTDDGARVSAAAFGAWVRALPDLLAPTPSPLPPPTSRPQSSAGKGHAGGHSRAASVTFPAGADVQAHRLVSLPHSRRPSLRSAAGSRNPSLLAAQRASWAVGPPPSSSVLGPPQEEMEQVTSWALAQREVESASVLISGMQTSLATVVDQEVEEHEHDHEEDAEHDHDHEQDHEHDHEASSRSASTQKRRKRGARKGKGVQQQQQLQQQQHPHPDDTLETLAIASQTLAREISRKSRSSSLVGSGSVVGVPSPLSATSTMYNATTSAYGAPPSPAPAQVSLGPLPLSAPSPASASTSISSSQPMAPTLAPTPAPAPTITKKPSKWRLGFGKSNSNSSNAATPAPVKEDAEKAPSSTVNNVASLLNSLNASSSSSAGIGISLNHPNASSAVPARLHPHPHPYQQEHVHTAGSALNPLAANMRYAHHQQQQQQHLQHPSASANSSMVSLDEPRGRRYRANAPAGNLGEGGMWGASTVSAFANSGHGPASNDRSPYSSSSLAASSSSSSSAGSSGLGYSYASSSLLSVPSVRQRGVSPASVSQASVLSASTTSSNWRSSTSSAATSSSAFTRYSNGSVRSVSTAATSVSSASNNSWRSGKTGPNGRDYRMPANVKYVEQLPWELGEVPRQQYMDPETVTFSQPPQRRAPKPKKNSNLDTISERPPPSHALSSAGSSTELDRTSSGNSNSSEGNGNGNGEEGSGATPRKVQKGQINALAKMLSALRR